MFQSLLEICVSRSGTMYGRYRDVTLVSSADILGLRTSIKTYREIIYFEKESGRLLSLDHEVRHSVVGGENWLGKPPNIKVENNGAVVYVGSSLTVHNPLFFVHKL